MAKKCMVTGKKTTRGNTYAIRGIAKKKKGIGLKVTGKTRRSFFANIVKKRFWFDEENRFVTLKLSANAIRTINKRGLAPIIREMRAEGTKI